MKVRVSSNLDCPAEKVWNEVQKPSLLLEISNPLARIVSSDPGGFPSRWESGHTYHCKSYLFGVLPTGERTLRIERVDANTHQIQSRETDRLCKRWDHLIAVKSDKNGLAEYTDEIEIEAGLLTPLVSAWAHWFYRHRQGKWKVVAARLKGIS